MPQFKYVGTDAQQCEIGSVHEFADDPHDSRWQPADPEPAEKVKK